MKMQLLTIEVISTTMLSAIYVCSQTDWQYVLEVLLIISTEIDNTYDCFRLNKYGQLLRIYSMMTLSCSQQAKSHIIHYSYIENVHFVDMYFRWHKKRLTVKRDFCEFIEYNRFYCAKIISNNVWRRGRCS